MHRNRTHDLLLATATWAAVVLSGCGSSSSEATVKKAQTALDTALDAWTRQEPPEKFAEMDPDWKAGYRLLSFLTSDARRVDGRPDQVRCRVSLALKDRQGKRVDKKVVYLVELGDTVTMRRKETK